MTSRPLVHPDLAANASGDDVLSRDLTSHEEAISALAAAGFEPLLEEKVPGTIRRGLTTARHLLALLAGGVIDHVRAHGHDQRPDARRHGLSFRLLQATALVARAVVDRELAAQPFAVQLRLRFQRLGPTYIKLGQMLALRRDILPRALTDELGKLLDRLPAVTYPRFCELVAGGLGRPVDEMFAWIESEPTGSASIAQSHRAATIDGDSVIIKVVKPGIREILERDAQLLRLLGRLLQLPFRRYQPRRVLDELMAYTVREADLDQEADNAEVFAANFHDRPDIVFPQIFRRFSSDRVLTMEFLAGIRPDAAAAQRLDEAERRELVSLGAEAIIRMIYRDGFFHADLHPGNLLLLAGSRAGFIDLGIVGRLDDRVRRTLLYYFYCLTSGDARGAARYLTAIAEPLGQADPDGFRRAVQDTSLRWHRSATFRDFSLAQLILESIALGGRYRMLFPIEMVLMVKALVTFEAVGNLLQPGFDIGDVSRPHASAEIIHMLSPLRVVREGIPAELVDAAVKVPLLVTEGLRMLEQATRKPARSPLAGVSTTIFGGFSLVAAAILTGGGTPWPVPAALAAFGVVLAIFGSRR